MKTFNTEKNNIPEGATHYFKETENEKFAWWDEDNALLLCPGNNNHWEPPHSNDDISSPIPIPQTKEVEWVNGLPPVGSIVHGRFMHTSETDGKWQIDCISESVGVYTAVETGKQFTFATDNVILSKIEMEAEKLEREREENGKAFYGQMSDIETSIMNPDDNGYPNKWYELRDEWKEVYMRQAECIRYRKDFDLNHLNSELDSFVHYAHQEAISNSCAFDCDEGQGRFISEGSVNALTSRIKRAINDVHFRDWFVVTKKQELEHTKVGK